MAKRTKKAKLRVRRHRVRLAGSTDHPNPTAPPGSLIDDETAPDSQAHVFLYGPDAVDERHMPVAKLRRPTKKEGVLWVDVVGAKDADALAHIGALFDLHALSLEDVNNGGQRPKFEDYDGHLFLVTRIITPGPGLVTEQISLFLGSNFVVSVQERPGDCFEPVRERLRQKRGRVRDRGADYLAYALLDAVIDHFAPLVEAYADRLEELEVQVMEGQNGADAISQLFDLRRELQSLKRWSMAVRDSIDRLRGHSHTLVTADTRTYLRDCHDHAVRVVDAIDGWRDFCAALMDLHYARSGQQLNEVMKVLTIISTIFIPLSFVAGVYGMNFDREVSAYNMPELGWVFGYPIVVGLMLVMVVGQLFYFRRRGWLRG